MSGKHARLSASSAHRWIECPGSPGGESEPNIHAATGTLAHEIAAGCLTGGGDPAKFLGKKKTIDGFEVQVNQEMVDHVRDYMQMLEEDRQPDDVTWTEMPLLDVLQTVDPDFGGTADRVRYRPSTQELWVVDLKYGEGVYVEVANNVQLRMYALGVLLYVLRKGGFKVKRVKSSIFQPRYEGAEPLRSEEFDAVALLDFAADLQMAAVRTRLPNPELKAGSHCRFCPKRRTCSELIKHEQTVVASGFSAAVPVEQIAQWLASWQLAKERGKAIEEHAYALASKGVEIPGWKLVDKMPRRQWKREGDVIEWAQANAIEPYAPREILSPAQLEERVRATAPRGKKKEAAAVLEQFVERISSGTALVPTTDNRPAVKAAVTAADFQAQPVTPALKFF